MCLAIPAQVVSADPAAETAIVALGPVKKEISIALLDNVAPGDYVLIHVGYALHKVSPEEAERTLAMIREAGEEASLPPLAGRPRMKYVDEFRDRRAGPGACRRHQPRGDPPPLQHHGVLRRPYARYLPLRRAGSMPEK